jgi:hypothetical protein
MQSSNFQFLTFLISLVCSFAVIFFGLPLWIFVLLIPGLVYSQLLIAHNYNFRDSISLEPIPQAGYEKRIADLESNQTLFSHSGFLKFDEFYMQTSNDILAFAYQHKNLPILGLEYHLEKIRAIDLNTKFQDEISLTTTNIRSSHLLERSDTKLFQSFPEMSFEEILHKHIQGIEFLKEQGFEPEEPELSSFRSKFLENFIKAGRKFKGLLGPLMLLNRYYFGNKYEYRKTIQEQFLAKSFQLPPKLTEQKPHLLQQ